MIYSNNNDKIYIEIKKKKIKIYDISIPNIKIKIQKIINPESNKGKYILYFLGYYNNNNINIIKCKYIKKTKWLFNDYYYVLLIKIEAYNNTEASILYKYNILNNNKYKYINTFMTVI
jgi:hypothetical protein